MRQRVLVMVAACALLAAACGQSAAGGTDAVGGDLTVFAAVSLTDAFSQMGEDFAAENAEVGTVDFNFGSSSDLSVQITQGAPADVFASASPGQMDVVAEAELVDGEPQDFTGNLLQIAVEPGNPLGIEELADLTDPAVLVVLAAEEVPAGEYTREALTAAGLEVKPVSLETDVRQVLGKVTLGEADAGIVYTSDVTAAGDDVEGVEIPADANVPATYPIAALSEAPNAATARAFVDYALSDAGQATLTQFGFQAP